MDDIEIFDLVKYANENQPIDFAASLDKLLSQRAMDALAAKKQEMAQSMFNDPNDESEEDYGEEELQQALDDLDVDIEEIDDQELDFEDSEDSEDEEDYDEEDEEQEYGESDA